jgi:hypothetical protein
MNTLRPAVTLSAMIVGFAFSAVGYAQGEAGAAKQEPAVQSSSDLTSPVSAATGDTRSPAAAQENQKASQKHPPTAAMDSATPVNKSAAGTMGTSKHPPTRSMDSAAPDEKSPPSSDNGKPMTETTK